MTNRHPKGFHYFAKTLLTFEYISVENNYKGIESLT